MKRISLIALLFLSGCMVGPRFHSPHAPCKETWMVQEAITDNTIGSWWTLFNDPELNRLIALAEEQNLSLEIACYRIEEARARLGIAVGEFFPQVQEGVGTTQRVKLSRTQANPPPLLDFKNSLLGFNISWELDFWGRYRRGIRAEAEELYATCADYDNVMVLLFADVASVYIRIRTIQEQIRIVTENIAIETRGLEISEAQFQGGFVSELDKQQALALLKSTEARIPDLQKDLRQAENALCVLLGIAPQEISCLLDGSPAKIPSIQGSLEVTLPESLLYRRPDILSAYYQAAAQSERIGIAISDFYPQISLSGFLGLQSKGALFNRGSLTYDYGTDFIWPLFNYGRIYYNVELQKSLFMQLVTQYKNKVLIAYEEVEDALIAYNKYQEQAELLAASANAAIRSVDLSKTQYVEGMTDYTTVLNTQESLLSAQESLVTARGNIALSLVAAYKALGGGWDPSGYPPSTPE